MLLTSTRNQMMKFSRITALSAVILIALVTIVGKGGGDAAPAAAGGGGSGNPIALDSTNAEMVTSAVLEAVVNAQNLPLAGGQMVGGLAATVMIDEGPASPASVAGIIADQVNATLERAKLGALPVGVEVTTDCGDGTSGGGTIVTDTTGTLNMAGFTVITTYNDCDFANSLSDEVLVGSFAFTITAITGDFLSPPFQIDTTVTFDGFGTNSADGDFSIDGSADVAVSSDDGVVLSTAVSLTAVTYTFDGVAQTISDFTTILTIDQSVIPAIVTFGATGTVDIPGGGTVSFETVGNFVLFVALSEAIITGDGSTINFIAIDNVTVSLEIDSDGDGTVDQTIVTMWDDLLAGVDTGVGVGGGTFN
jgi:hypothetical protein